MEVPEKTYAARTITGRPDPLAALTDAECAYLADVIRTSEPWVRERVKGPKGLYDAVTRYAYHCDDEGLAVALALAAKVAQSWRLADVRHALRVYGTSAR